ncbi:MAG: PHP domain-containing protein [Anaerolineaceae bacterium]|nr:PHP domain-containing protein [Anaerolineaceae bacterium]
MNVTHFDHAQVITGEVGKDRTLSYVLVPFHVPEHTGRIEVTYAYDAAISSDPAISGGNVVDIGIFDPRGADFLGHGFRGWSGSERLTFFITPDEATSGYIAGPIQAGEWNIVLGFYKVAPQGCHYQITVKLQAAAESDNESVAFRPRLPVRTSAPRLAKASGWYKGELHCHSLHSDGDSSPEAIVRAAEKLGLDFLAVTDHNNYSQQMDLNAVSTNLILIPGSEVTTFKGHWNIWGADRWIDFRVTSEADMSATIQAANEAGYLTSCNHPRPYGPDWMYPNVEGYACVEVWNGPWQFLNEVCLNFWETRLKQGKRLVAVGGSDMHRMLSENVVQLAHPTNYIYCEGEPSAAALLNALRAGHAFITNAPDGPQLHLRSGQHMMGDSVARAADNRLPVELFIKDGAGLSVQLVGAQGIIFEQAIQQAEEHLSLTTNVQDTSYIYARLISANNTDNMLITCITNPLYID